MGCAHLPTVLHYGATVGLREVCVMRPHGGFNNTTNGIGSRGIFQSPLHWKSTFNAASLPVFVRLARGAEVPSNCRSNIIRSWGLSFIDKKSSGKNRLPNTDARATELTSSTQKVPTSVDCLGMWISSRTPCSEADTWLPYGAAHLWWPRRGEAHRRCDLTP